MKTETVSATLGRWLKNNLGAKCLAPCTGQDWAALEAAVHLAQLWCYSDTRGRELAASAFSDVVTAMQPEVRYLAFHAVAKAGDWGHRWELWDAAGLARGDLANAPECKYGPRPRPSADDVRAGVEGQQAAAWDAAQPDPRG